MVIDKLQDRIDELIRRLWKRCGREDVKLIGLLITNTEGNAWGRMLDLIDKSIPLDLTLEFAEEIKRSGRVFQMLNFSHKRMQTRYKNKMQC